MAVSYPGRVNTLIHPDSSGFPSPKGEGCLGGGAALSLWPKAGEGVRKERLLL